MSDTVNIPIQKSSGWILIPNTGDAFITFSKAMEYVISENPPLESLFGHHLRTFEILTFGSDTENLYVRGEGVVVLTQSSAINKGGEPRPEGLYTGRRAQTVAFYPEQNVKNGLQYYIRKAYPLLDAIKGLGPIASGESQYITFTTTTKKVLFKSRIVSFIGEEFNIELFNTPVIDTPGTQMTVRNYNGVSPVPTTVSVFKDVTVTSEGTPLDDEPEYYFGAAATGRSIASSIPSGRERVLPENTTFLIKITNSGKGSGRFQYFGDWYEGEPDLPVGA